MKDRPNRRMLLGNRGGKARLRRAERRWLADTAKEIVRRAVMKALKNAQPEP